MNQNLSNITKLLESNRQAAVPLLLRTALIVVLSYAAISSLVSPSDWVGYLPSFLTQHFPTTWLLRFFSLYELLLVAALLSGFYVRYAALLAAATFAGIVLSNLALLPISFRDIGLFFGALALAFAAEE